MAGFDVETAGEKNDFVLCSFVSDSFKKVFFNQLEAVNFLLNIAHKRKVIIFSINLSFDITALLKGTEYIKYIIPIIRNGFMIECRLKYNRVCLKFYDCLNYIKFSAEKFGMLVNAPKLPKPDFLGKQINYSSEQLNELIRYNLQDSLISFKTAEYINKCVSELGARLRPTISSTAMDLYRRKYQKYIFITPTSKEYDLLKSGYFGGRTEAIYRGKIEDYFIYDINSMYPYVMKKHKYPLPRYFYFKNKIKENDLNNEGVCYAELKAPDLFIPYLPCKTNKLIFPCGTLKGYWSFFELRKAVNLGYSIDKLGNGLVYYATEKLFKDYVKNLYKLRKEYIKNNDERQLMVKQFLNSLYGKYAQNYKDNDKIFHVEYLNENPYLVNLYKNTDFDVCSDFIIFKRIKQKMPCFINPIISIYTTAFARDYLYKFINNENTYYYDTDSIFTKKHYCFSEELGELKKEAYIKNSIIIKPKMYILLEYKDYIKNKDSFNKIKCKGFNFKNLNEFEQVFNGRELKSKKICSFKESLRRKKSFNEWVDFTKIYNLEDDKRLWRSQFNRFKMQKSAPLYV